MILYQLLSAPLLLVTLLVYRDDWRGRPIISYYVRGFLFFAAPTIIWVSLDASLAIRYTAWSLFLRAITFHYLIPIGWSLFSFAVINKISPRESESNGIELACYLGGFFFGNGIFTLFRDQSSLGFYHLFILPTCYLLFIATFAEDASTKRSFRIPLRFLFLALAALAASGIYTLESLRHTWQPIVAGIFGILVFLLIRLHGFRAHQT